MQKKIVEVKNLKISFSQNKEKIDAVLLDAPCSATGTIRKHPDIVKNRSKVNLDKYISLQIDLIKQSLTWLDEGGILIYAVCSLQKKEGEEQIKSILQTLQSQYQ